MVWFSRDDTAVAIVLDWRKMASGQVGAVRRMLDGSIRDVAVLGWGLKAKERGFLVMYSPKL